MDQWVNEYTLMPGRGWVRTAKRPHGRSGAEAGMEWFHDGKLLRIERMTRREAVLESGEWRPVWAVMRALADVHGPENVRLVVWFDS